MTHTGVQSIEKTNHRFNIFPNKEQVIVAPLSLRSFMITFGTESKQVKQEVFCSSDVGFRVEGCTPKSPRLKNLEVMQAKLNRALGNQYLKELGLFDKYSFGEEDFDFEMFV